MDEIRIGDWCVFEKENKMMIGLILSFKYLIGKTFQDQAYTKSTILVQSSAKLAAKPIGVLGSWYSWNKRGELESESVLPDQQHCFIAIESYKGNICQPLYEKQKIKISLDLVKKLNEMDEDFRSA